MDLAMYRRLLRQARPQWLNIAGIFVLDLLATPLGLLSPLPLKIAVDNALGGQPLPRVLIGWLPPAAVHSRPFALALAVGLLILIALLTQIQSLMATLLRTYTGEKLVLEFRAKLFAHAQRLSLSYHDMRSPADSTYRIQYDAAAIQYVPIDGCIPFITAAFTLVAMVYVTIRMDWKLALVALTISPLLYVTSQTCRRRLRAQSREVKNLESSAMSVVQEVLSALRVVKAFGREDHERNRYLDHSNKGLRARIHLGFVGGIFDLAVGLITAVGTAIVLWVGVRHVESGLLSLGELLLVMSYLSRLYEPLRTIGKKSASLQGYLASAERAFSMLDQTRDVTEKPNARPLQRAFGEVVFRDMSFAYPDGHRVLHNVSFGVAAGTRVGIAGRTGAGKTTLLNLLIRFYDPGCGQILLDGIDLREYKLADLRNQFAIVLQEPVLFSTTLIENIAYARPEASEEEIIRAAKLAKAHDFITCLPEGYQTRVGERGMRLSGGERQRISLARAFLKDAPILVLDEPTSSVDIRTEAAIMEAMERLMKGRTTFIIAHRLSTIENCDLRLEIDNGRLVRALHRSAAGDMALTAGGSKVDG
jgi:ATP-binding cassette, subfamily B, bacterial